MQEDSFIPKNRLFPWPLVIIAATAFAVVLPFFFLGDPSGHDFEFHVNSWMEVLSQWKQGIIYPRWAALAHYGYGEARFAFYPPASWMLGAALGALLPWQAAPGAYVWIVLTLSGCSMFLLARCWLNRHDAIFTAALYAANPYYIVVVYWRSAYAELLAGALLPLLLLFALRSEREGRRIIIPLGLIVAAAWITNAPAAVMVNYSLALLLVVVAIVRRSPRVLISGVLAILLGAALAAFYLLPAAYEERWVNIAQVLAPGVRPEDNFLFTTINDPDHNRFNLLVSLIASAEAIVLAGAAILSRQRRRLLPEAWWTLFAWAAAAALLMFSVTSLAWDYLPELRFVQLPWRWLLCLNAAFALMVTMAWRRWLQRALVCALMLGLVAFVSHRVQPPWWDRAADIAEMRNNIQEGQGYEGRGYEGTDEYVPAGADPYEIKLDARRVVFEGAGTIRIHVMRWEPESKFLTATASQPGNLVLRLFDYPAWQAEVNGQVVATGATEVTRQMIVPIRAGENSVRIRFTRTWDRSLGGIISTGAILLVCGIIFTRRSKAVPPRRTQSS
jgi:hypothetical protein